MTNKRAALALALALTSTLALSACTESSDPTPQERGNFIYAARHDAGVTQTQLTDEQLMLVGPALCKSEAKGSSHDVTLANFLGPASNWGADPAQAEAVLDAAEEYLC